MLFFFVLSVLLSIWMASLIAQKAGFSGWWGVTQAIPIVNLIMIWVLAFIDWGEPKPLTGSKKEDKIISAWD